MIANDNTRILIKLSKENHQKLKLIAKEENRSVSSLIEYWIIKNLKEG